MASTTPRLDFDAWWYLWLSQRQTANKPAAIDAARAGWSAAARTLAEQQPNYDEATIKAREQQPEIGREAVLEDAAKLFAQFALLAAERNWSPDSIGKIAKLQDW